MKNVVVIGGGTAGWLSALFFNKLVPNCNVTLIASEEIGILGAGEGTVNYFSPFLKNLEIDPYKIIEHCKGTIKTGVKFVNWLGNNDIFYHPFSYVPPQRHFSFDINYDEASLLDEILGLKSELYSYDTGDLLSSLNKTPISKNTNYENAFHFDAVEVAKYLKSVAVSRGVKYFDDIVKGFEQDQNGNVVKVICNNKHFESDFVVDCTGFKRILIGNLFKEEWVEVKNQLPVDKAIPFFLPADKKLETCTTATAMSSGWSWKIPLQHRSGCGYVFNSNFCSEEEAAKEIRNKFGNVEITKCFNFKSGYFKKAWSKNCLSVGLSGGFLEPLEATSIWTTMITLTHLIDEIDVMFNNDIKTEIARKNINDLVCNLYENTTNFLQMHYLTKRDDTEFWKFMNNDSFISDKLRNQMELMKYRPLTVEEANLTKFNSYSWFRFAKVCNIIDKEQYKKRLLRKIHNNENNYLKERKRIINILKYEISSYKTQNDVVEFYLKRSKNI